MTKIVLLISKTAPKWLKLILSMALMFNSATLAHAAKSESVGESEGQTLTIAPYLNTCEGLLGAIQENRVESFLIDQTNSKEQLLGLMADYNLVFTKQYLAALTLELNERKIEFPENGKSPRKFINQIREVLKMNDAGFDALSMGVLDKMITLAAANGNANLGRVESLRLKNLKAAIETSPKKAEIMRLLEVVARLNLLEVVKAHTLKHNRGFKTHEEWEDISDRAPGILFWTLGMAMAFLFGDFGAIGLLETFLGYSALVELTGYSSAEWINSTFQGSIMIGGLLGAYLGLKGRTQISQWVTSGDPFRVKLTPDEALSREVHVIERNYTAAVNNLLWNHYSGVESKILDFSSACSKGVCALSPAQIIYLGHLEILEVRELSEAAVKSMGFVDLGEAIQALKEKAQDVVSSPGKLDKQFALFKSVEQFEQAFSYDGKRSESAAAALAEKVIMVRAYIKNLADAPFKEAIAKRSPSEIRKIELLMLKMETDLKQLKDLELEQTQAYANLKVLEPIIHNMNATKPTNSDKNLWLKFAEDLVVALDGLAF